MRSTTTRNTVDRPLTTESAWIASHDVLRLGIEFASAIDAYKYLQGAVRSRIKGRRYALLGNREDLSLLKLIASFLPALPESARPPSC